MRLAKPSSSPSLSASFFIRIFIIIIIIYAVTTNNTITYPSCHALSTDSLVRRNYYPKNLSIQQPHGYLQYKQQHDDSERRGYNRKQARGVVEEAVSMTQNSAYLHAMEDQRSELFKELNYHTGNNNVNMLDYENLINARFTRYQRRYNLRTTRQQAAAAAAAASSLLPPTSLSTAATMMRPQMLQGVPIPIFNNHHNYNAQHRRITNSDYPCYNNNDIEMECIALPPAQFEDATYSECNVIHCTNILIPFNDDYDDDDDTRKHNMELMEQEEGILIIGTTIVNDIKYYILQIYNNVLVPYRRSAPFDISMVDTSVAYWLRNQLHSAIYGRVRYGTILQYLVPPLHVEMLTTMDDNNNVESTIAAAAAAAAATVVAYISTGTSVAIKEISWDSISEQGYKLAEDPIKEVAAMQYMYNFVHTTTQQQQQQHYQQQQQWTDNINNNIAVGDYDDTTATTTTTTTTNNQQHPNHHIMLPIDLLSNEQYLYSIIPYYNGGRLLDRIENKGRLSEVESRYYIRQIIVGLSVLKMANVVHRDISPENIMLHDNECYIIDMGMCLRIPTLPTSGTTTTTTTTSITTTTTITILQQQQQGGQQQQQQQQQHRRRTLILPQTPCGKWHYLSPEICASVEPFDGPAVDLWAVGIILYIMLTGSPPPWKEPRLTDTNFCLFMGNNNNNSHTDSSNSGGSSSSNLKHNILSEENALGLSSDVLDLLQCMLKYNPEDRLSLEQVMDHPWMKNNVGKKMVRFRD